MCGRDNGSWNEEECGQQVAACLGCGTKGGGTFDGGGQRDKMLGVQGKKLCV